MKAKKKTKAEQEKVIKRFKDKTEQDTFMYYYLLTMIGYATALLCEAKGIMDLPANHRWHVGHEWYLTAVENVVYKQIPPPRCP